MTWQIAYGRMLKPGYSTIYYHFPRYTVTNGREMGGSYLFLWQARLKVRHLNRNRIMTFKEVQAERARFERAMKEVG